MEFKCKCGHLIEDGEDLNYKAKLLPDIEFDAYTDQIDAQINEFIVMIMDGKREEWMESHFMEGYPRDLSNAQMLGDVLNWIYLGKTKEVFQCENCNRLWIEKNGVNLSFSPEEGDAGSILI
jgi:hypothetical protein